MATYYNETTAPRSGATGSAMAPAAGTTRISWGAVFAGAIVALAAMLLLSALGVGIGAATIDPLTEKNPVSGVPTGSAIYLIIVQLVSLAIGGYVAARLAGIPRTIGSALHGVSVWAVASLAMAWMATTAVGSLVSGSASVLTSAAGGAARAASAVIPDDLQWSDLSVSDVGMKDLPASIQRVLRKQGVTQENFKAEARQMLRSVVSKQEQAAARTAATETARDVIASPGDAGADVNQLIDRLFGGPGAVLSEEDRKQAIDMMQARFGLSQADAEKLYNRWTERARNMAAEVDSAVSAAKKKSLEAASAAASAVSKFAFATFFASLLGLLAAGAAAAWGRPQDLIGSRAGDRFTR